MKQLAWVCGWTGAVVKGLFRVLPGLVVLGPLVLAPAMTVTQVAAMDWATYRNAEYGFAVDYPTQLFASQTFSADGDATTLLGPDGLVEFRAYAFNNGDELDLETVMNITLEDQTGTTIATRRITDGHAVVSGTVKDAVKGERVFHKRLQPSADSSRVAVFEFLYPEAKRSTIDPLLERIGTSLTAPKNLN